MDTEEKRLFHAAYSQHQATETWDEVRMIIIASPEFVKKKYKKRVDIFFFLKLAEQSLRP